MTLSAPEHNCNNVEEQNINRGMWADGFVFFLKTVFFIGFDNAFYT